MMSTLTFLTAILVNYILSDKDICDYDCSYKTTDKPCRSVDKLDTTCTDYNYYGVCPADYIDCSQYNKDLCNKKCSYKTIGKPCMHINKGDNTCFDYMEYGDCPPGTKDCFGNVKTPCEYCDKNKPCLDDNKSDYSCLETNKYGECNPGSTLCVYNDEPKKYEKKCDICSKTKPCLGDEYIYGNYNCYQQIYKDGKYICPDKTSICEYYDPSTCDKECSYETRGKPCIHLNKGDNTCFDYIKYNGCPPGTKDCSNNVNNPCEYCKEDKPCLHDNYGDFSCLKTNKYGECNPGSTLCVYSSNNYYGGLTEISNEIENIMNKEKTSEKELISITLFSSALVYLVGSVCFISILYLIWKNGCFNDNNGTIKFKTVNNNDPEDVALNK